MSKNKSMPNELSEDIYMGGKGYIFKVLILAFVFLLLGFLLNYPLKQDIEKRMAVILSNKVCNIQYDKLDVALLPPHIKIVKPIIPNRCHGMRNKSIPMNNIELKLTRPSFYPPGLRFHAQITEGETVINAYPAISVSKHMIKIEDSVLDLSLVNKFIGKGNILSGTLDITSLLTLKSPFLELGKMDIYQADLLVKSDNLSSNTIKLMNGLFTIPQLDIGKTQIVATLTKSGELLIKELSLGSADAPIVAKFSGKIIVNKQNFSKSDMSLTGEIKFSKQFMEKIPVGLLVGGKKPDSSGFYKLKLAGKVGRPKHTFL